MQLGSTFFAAKIGIDLLIYLHYINISKFERIHVEGRSFFKLHDLFSTIFRNSAAMI